MLQGRVTRGLSRVIKAYWRGFGFAGIPLGVLLLLLVLGLIAEVFDDLKFALQSPEQHLQLALQACGRPDAGDSAGCPAPFEAKRQLNAIPSNSKEHDQAANLLSSIQAKLDRGKQEAKELAYARFQRNKDGTARMFTSASLWDAWKDPANGQWLQSFAIVVTEPNELMASVHDRMPVILHPRDFDRWLSRDEKERPPIDLLRPFPADEMEAFEVSPDVGNVKNNSPELLNSK